MTVSLSLVCMAVFGLILGICYERKLYNLRVQVRNLEQNLDMVKHGPSRQAEMDAWIQQESTPERAEERIAQYLARNPRF